MEGLKGDEDINWEAVENDLDSMLQAGHESSDEFPVEALTSEEPSDEVSASEVTPKAGEAEEEAIAGEETPAPTEGESQPSEVETPPSAETTPPVAADEFDLKQPLQAPQSPTSEDPALRARSLQQLEQFYALDDATRNELEDNLAEALPKLLARTHYGAMRTAIKAVVDNLPYFMESATQRQTAQSKLDQAFYGRWPQLNTAEGRQMVEQFKGIMLRQKPTMTMQEYIDDVGAAAMVRLRLPVQAAAAQPAAPAAKVKPSTPALPGGSRAQRQVAQKSKGAFEVLDEEFEELML